MSCVQTGQIHVINKNETDTHQSVVYFGNFLSQEPFPLN